MQQRHLGVNVRSSVRAVCRSRRLGEKKVQSNVTMACPSQDFIESTTGQKLEQIKTLNLEGMGFPAISADTFNKMINLTTLNLSRNELTAIPADLHLPKLRELDISENNIKSLLFAKHLPMLEEIYTDGNGIETPEKYIVATVCPHLKTLNKYRVDALQKVVANVKDRLWPQVQGVWSASLADKYSNGINEDAKESVLEEFVKVLSKQSLTAPTSIVKYIDFVVKQQASELINSVCSGKYESPRKRRRHESTPGTPSTPRFTAIKRKGLVGNLPHLPDYEALHFIRCHAGGSKEHGDNDPTDNLTQVWRTAFEPNPHKPGEFTNVVATVGGHNVCLIDCNSGKVMKRYKELGEHFFTVAWTTIEMGEQKWPTNVLAAAGVRGCVKLLHPDQLVCYHEFNVCEKRRPDYINAALFHPTRTTHLYCGDSNGNITAWDIGVPKGAAYQTTVTALFTLRSRTNSVVNILCDRNDHLIAGCEGALLVWNVAPEVRGKTREANSELVLPGKNETNVDGLTTIGEDLVASKVTGEGCIYLWRISSVLEGHRKKQTIKINPMAILEWRETETMYMNLGACTEGVLACGDDRGQLWLYNVSRLLKTSSIQADELFRPSRIIPWPMCETQGKRDLENLMIDVLDQEQTERIVNHVSVSQDSEFVVASMANNMVCIWRRL